MLNANLPKRRAKLKIALTIGIISLAAGSLLAGKYWLRFPTAALVSGAVVSDNLAAMAQQQAKDFAELYYTFAAGDNPFLLQSMQKNATTDMHTQIASLIEERRNLQAGLVQTATVTDVTRATIRERAASLTLTLKVQNYRAGLSPTEQEIEVKIKLIRQAEQWLVSSLVPKNII